MDSWHTARAPRQLGRRPGATLGADFCHTRAALLAVAGEAGDVTLVDASAAPDASAETQVAALDCAAWDVSWAPDDSSLAVACADGCVRTYGGEEMQPMHTLAHADLPLRSVRHLGRDVLVSAGRDGCIRLWDMRVASQPVLAIADAHASSAPATPEPRSRRRSSGAHAPSSVGALCPLDDVHVASIGQPDYGIRVWDLRRHAARRAVREIAPSTPDCRRPRAFLSLCAADGVLHALSADNCVYSYAAAGAGSAPLAVRSAPGFRTGGSFYTRSAISPCGRLLACGSAETAAFVFDLETDGGPRSAAAQPQALRGLCPAAHALGEHRYEVTCVAWSRVPDGPEYVLVGGEDYVVRVWTNDRRSHAAYDERIQCRPEAVWAEARSVATQPCDAAPPKAAAESPATEAAVRDAWPSIADYAAGIDRALRVPVSGRSHAPLAELSENNPFCASSPRRTPARPTKAAALDEAPPSPASPSVRQRQLTLTSFLTPPAVRQRP